MKVSDEFTVPLCRGHHRQLHQAGNEITWWEGLKINPLEIAKGLWEQTHPKSAAADTATPAQPNDKTKPIPESEKNGLRQSKNRSRRPTAVLTTVPPLNWNDRRARLS